MESDRTETAGEAGRTRVVIVGGGAVGLEAMLALRELGGDRVEVEIFSPRSDFEIRPLAVWKALGHGEILKFNLQDLADRAGVEFGQHSVISVDPDKRRVILQDETEVSYDYLLVATGTKSLWVVPGAGTFWGPSSDEAIAEFMKLRHSIGPSRIVLTMPNLSAWPLPVYELALYLAAEAADAAMSNVMITVATPERVPLEIFGETVSGEMESMLAANRIDFLAGVRPLAFENGRLSTQSGESIVTDAVITLPALTGRKVKGIDYTSDGFIEVDGLGQINGLTREYAAGDVVDHPVKFGGLATAQADVVASAIASRAWGLPKPEPFVPELQGTLLTAEGPVPIGVDSVRREEELEEGEQWDPSRKIHGKYLSPFLATESV